MKCPTCGAEITLSLVPSEHDPEAPPDPLAPVLRRLEAEQHGPPVHERGHESQA